MSDGLYLYGLIPAGPLDDLAVMGLGSPPGRVVFIARGAVAAVVSRVRSFEPDPCHENVMGHELVLGELLRRGIDVLPVSFGQVFPSEVGVRRFLADGGDEFQRVLGQIRGKVELGLRLLGEDPDAAVRIRKELSRFAVATRENRVAGRRMLANLAFLVERHAEASFDRAVEQQAKVHPHLEFRYSGPWPPHNFVTVRVRIEPC